MRTKRRRAGSFDVRFEFGLLNLDSFVTGLFRNRFLARSWGEIVGLLENFFGGDGFKSRRSFPFVIFPSLDLPDGMKCETLADGCAR